MDTCRLGESFPIRIKISDPQNPTSAPVVDSASYTVEAPDGTPIVSGYCTVDRDGIAQFRFDADNEGINVITFRWTSGQNIWIAEFLMSVVG